jgi:Protein of unknown function (DUF1569)
MLNESKRQFLETGLIDRIREIDPAIPGRWGKMSAQHMVEHLSGFFRISTNKLKFPFVTDPELLPKLRAFLLSEKEFRENTKAPILPDEPLPLQSRNMNEALAELDNEVRFFFNYFSSDSERKTEHPVFGELNFAEWVQLHHKHVKHHLRQFGLEI